MAQLAFVALSEPKCAAFTNEIIKSLVIMRNGYICYQSLLF